MEEDPLLSSLKWFWAGFSSGRLLDWGSQLPVGCWPEASPLFFVCRSLHRLPHNMTYNPHLIEQARKARESSWSNKSSKLNLEVISHLASGILCLWQQQVTRSSPHSRGGDHIGCDHQQVGIVGPFWKMPITVYDTMWHEIKTFHMDWSSKLFGYCSLPDPCLGSPHVL